MKRSGRWSVFVALSALLVGCKAPSPATAPAPDQFERAAAHLSRPDATSRELVSLGEQYLSRGEPLKAAELAFRARKADPKQAGAHNLLGIIYAQGGERQKARASFEQALKSNPGELGTRLNLARLQLEDGRALEALRTLQDPVRSGNATAETWVLTGQAQRLRGSHTAAGASFQKAIALDPSYAAAHVALGVRELDFGRYAQGIPHLEKAYSLGDRDPATLSYYALALVTGRAQPADIERADQVLAEAGRPATPPALYAEGVIARTRKDYAAAQGFFRRVLAADPRHERALFALSEAQRLGGDRAGAARTLQQYDRVVKQRQRVVSLANQVQAEPRRTDLIREYGKALLATDRVAEAEAQFQTWASLATGDPDAKRWMARARARRESRP